jgi:hypothetical protein
MSSHTVNLCVLLAILAFGCKYPEPAEIQQKDSRPAIGVTGAPEGATLFVDGLDMGPASRYDGENNVLLVESGSHRVEVRAADGRVILSEEVFLSSSTTKVFRVQP